MVISSPSQVEDSKITPLGNSIAKQALIYTPLSRKGFIPETAFITLLPLPINNTSMGKRIKKVCMELQGFIIKASPLLRESLPNRPLNLLKALSATITSPAKETALDLLIICIICDYIK